MGRFFQNLKQKTIAGAGGPTSTQLKETGQTIFIEKSNSQDLGELILIQKANQLQHQNQTLPHPGLSSIASTSIPDSGAMTDIINPSNFEIFQVAYLAIKNEGAGTAAVTVGLTDGTTTVQIYGGNTTAGATTVILNPLGFNDVDSTRFSLPFLIDSSLKVVVSSDAAVTALMGYRTLSVK